MIETSLKSQYEQFKSENPKTRIRDAAKELGVSEAELVATGDKNIRLRPEFEQLLNEVSTLGYVMALTRNDHAVHERKGKYTKASFNGHVGLVVNPDIDLRLFMNNWQYAFAVQEDERLSLQFFDKWGTAVHKIYLTEKSNTEAYHALVSTYRFEGEQELDIARELPVAAEEKADSEINIPAFQQEWRDLLDTHNFFGILRKHGVSRIQSMRLAPEGYAVQIDKTTIESLLNIVSQKGTEIMIFIGNNSCLQIHTGQVERIVRTGPWINVLDAEFNMHLRDEAIESVWIVKKPTDLGLVHSIEAYDEKGNLVVQFFGKRKPNIPEREDWREVVQLLAEHA